MLLQTGVKGVLLLLSWIEGVLLLLQTEVKGVLLLLRTIVKEVLFLFSDCRGWKTSNFKFHHTQEHALACIEVASLFKANFSPVFGPVNNTTVYSYADLGCTFITVLWQKG